MHFSSLALLFVFAWIEGPKATTEAFSSTIVATTTTRRRTTTKTSTVLVEQRRIHHHHHHHHHNKEHQHHFQHTLSAVVYGWDDAWDDEDDDEEEDSTTSSSYSTFGSDDNADSCSADGAAVAESLTSDEDKMASLARLAAAFSPPERGIAIQDIERVEVICVQEDRIEIEAMLCEDMGCVSLSVPITFPTSCRVEDDNSAAFVGCVNKNIAALSISAASTLAQVTAFGGSVIETYDLNDLSRLEESVAYPLWWIPSIRHGTAIATECDTIRVLLNEDEFISSVIALAQDTLENAHHHAAMLEAAVPAGGADMGAGGINSLIEAPQKLLVKRAKVAAIGPAGICMKVAALYEYQKGLKILDVVYPFPELLTPVTDVETLRSIVLGAIVEAEA